MKWKILLMKKISERIKEGCEEEPEDPKEMNELVIIMTGEI